MNPHAEKIVAWIESHDGRPMDSESRTKALKDISDLLVMLKEALQ